MKQNKILITLLLTGMIESGLFISCEKKTPDFVVNDFLYMNFTDFEIKLFAYRAGSEVQFQIPAMEELKIRIKEGENNTILLSDSVLIQSGSTQFVMHYATISSSKNPIQIENYENRKISSNHYEFKFLFSEDYFD
jgi:hypothetical protein